MLRDFLAYYRPHRRLFMLDFGSAVLSGLLSLGFPLAVTFYIDRLLPGGDWSAILLATTGLLALYVLNTGLIAIVTYWGHVLGINIETEMRRRAFDHLQKLSLRFFDNQKTGHLVARLTKDLEEIGEVAHHGPEDIFIAVMTFLGAFTLMLAVHVPLALLTLLIVPLVMIVVLRHGQALTANWHAQLDRIGVFNARIEEVIGGARVVRAFANEPHERKLFARDNRGYRSAKLVAYRVLAFSLALNYLGMRLVQVMVLLAGTWFVHRGELTIGGFVGFLLLVNVFYQPIEKIAAVIENYPKGIAGFRRYRAFLALEPDIADTPEAGPAPTLRGDITFENVSFGYDPARPVVEDVNLTIQAGETVAFVGPSGAGKTTLLSLLPRFYEPNHGRILIDGQDIRSFRLASLRQQIGIVQQDVFLFAGTLRENIAYGRLEASEAEILDAARRARLDSLIAEYAEGLDMIVGERGVKLSGGQKQRVAIARIFLKNPPILILDEATSALDTETERAIQAALTELAVGRTSLVIAHRLATIRNADRIVVISEGGVSAAGSHENLLRVGGVYRRLHEAQNGA